MFRAAALATKIRLAIAQQISPGRITKLVANLAVLSDGFRTVGAQDYESYSLYAGRRYVGDAEAAVQLLEVYVARERRDARPLAPEIVQELARLHLGV
jgi:hypothetical protein